jgi:hypothetical protein
MCQHWTHKRVPRGDVPGPGLIDEGIDLLRRDECPGLGLNRIDRILIPISCNFFSESSSPKNSEVKRALPGAI